jgi:hypothetical protein
MDLSPNYPYNTITEAINVANVWDTILVAAGTYLENIDFMGKPIILKSIFGPQKTIIQGRGVGDVVTGVSGSTLEGFTVTGSGKDWYDCGVQAYLANMTIRGNIITGNWLGINTSNYREPLIVNNLICSNTHYGIVASYYSAPIIVNNTIAYNGEYGIASYSGTGFVVNNIIISNGIYGIYCSRPSSSPAIRYNDVYGNMMKDYHGCPLEEGNISYDPLFADVYQGDYHLSPFSPCVETGMMTPNVPPADINGTPRPYPTFSFPDMGAYEFPYLGPPLNFSGQKVRYRSFSWVEYTNVLTWQPNPDNANLTIHKYRIYQINGVRKILLAELGVNTFRYWHRGIDKDEQYEYAVCAVIDDGEDGPLSFVTVQ